jgi:exonuclease III
MRGRQHSQGGGLSCLVVNVNGLSAPAKRRTLFKRLMQLHADVVVLCETHSTSDEQVQGWVQEGAGPGKPWQGHAFWEHGADRSRGVAVLLASRAVKGDPVVSYQGAQGRILSVAFTGGGDTRWEVMGVYAPVEVPSRTAFFQGPFTAACAAKDPAAMLLVAGDFNCVTDVQDVQVPPLLDPAQNSRLQGGPDLLQVMSVAALEDVWRVQHPAELAFTRSVHSHPPGTPGAGPPGGSWRGRSGVRGGG